MSNCFWCGKHLGESDGKRYHKNRCAKEKGVQLRTARYGHSDSAPKEKIIKLCEWCGKPLPKNIPSAKKYHDGLCKENGYKETNARNSRSYRFRREMGFAKRR